MTRILLVALLLLGAPALAQGLPEPLRGAWYGPDCTAPKTMLYVTPRAATRLPLEGTARLWRFIQVRQSGDWTLATSRGAEAPRLGLRLEGETLASVEPDAKTRDDRLPGDAPAATWRRCPEPPAAYAALHGEGLAFLGGLERLEAACLGPAAPCIAALIAIGDVTRDGSLSAAEIARLMRGAAWVLAAQDGAAMETIAAANAAGAIGGLLAARLLVDSLDYDADGRLSLAELHQDRVPLAAGAGDAGGRPFRTENVNDGAGFLRGLIEGLIGTR